ncbi:MAG: TIGR04219 family outer membrane beta-barrel protein [Sulfuricurvum sp.]|nr:TIGR04219 family outer membrane beta-barrel protein [Sulfuricurvum sp.]
MIKSAILTLCLASISASAATILGFGAEVDYYTPSASGDFDYKNTQTRFNSDDESGYQVGVYLEHPLPLLPNIRIDFTPETSFSGADGIGGINKVSFEQTDITPYYEILDNVVDIDLGVSFKIIDATIEGSIDDRFSEVIPMGYLGVSITPPLSPLSVEGSVKYVGYDGDSLSDARIKVLWKIAAGLGAQAGYRYESLEISNRFDTNTNVTFKGPFVGLNYRF